MIFSKIKLTKAGTLEATYKNEDGDVIHYAGANLVHKDLILTSIWTMELLHATTKNRMSMLISNAKIALFTELEL